MTPINKKLNTTKKTILLVEDEEDLREIYKTKFTIDGYRVITTDSGAKVVNLALRKRPDMILLDIILPGKDGFSVLSELKANIKIKDIPVIIFSNLGQDWEIKRGQDLGAVKFLTKANVTPKEVVKIAEGILEKR